MLTDFVKIRVCFALAICVLLFAPISSKVVTTDWDVCDTVMLQEVELEATPGLYYAIKDAVDGLDTLMRPFTYYALTYTNRNQNGDIKFTIQMCECERHRKLYKGVFAPESYQCFGKYKDRIIVFAHSERDSLLSESSDDLVKELKFLDNFQGFETTIKPIGTYDYIVYAYYLTRKGTTRRRGIWNAGDDFYMELLRRQINKQIYPADGD